MSADGGWMMVWMSFAIIIAAAYLIIWIARIIVHFLLLKRIGDSRQKQVGAVIIIAVVLSVILVILTRNQICYVWQMYN